MSFPHFYQSAEEYPTGSNHEPSAGPCLNQTPILQHSHLRPNAEPHYDFAWEQPHWPLTPTSPAAPILYSPRQRNLLIQSGESPRQPCQPSSPVVSPRLEIPWIDNFHIDNLQGTFPYLLPGSESQ